MNFCRKILAAGMAAVMLAGVSMAEARQHGGVEPGAEANVEVRQNSGVGARTGTVKTAGADNEVSVRPVGGDEQVCPVEIRGADGSKLDLDRPLTKLTFHGVSGRCTS